MENNPFLDAPGTDAAPLEEVKPAVAEPVVKKYICNRWPEFDFGSEVKFHLGKFETSSPSAIALIEGSSYFRRQIIPQQ